MLSVIAAIDFICTIAVTETPPRMMETAMNAKISLARALNLRNQPMVMSFY